ncbi:hypothetical protein OC846_004360 [Tilletia horrida]|uniref:JmjC domain-containing protein n=1 Tax=Tilletia horrida TaxID=155126 RepID=A0AAN6JSW5_9BASI|nr:hypothetical protein OC845_003679 [Tilletia horrida]KAK0548743.1 hypothetical protein OC846_004360 [Tilletia horrida]KAK0563848.1 hypothetical protein OC861_004588 [Tilletia horrida]
MVGSISSAELDESLLRFAIHARELSGLPLRTRAQGGVWHPPSRPEPPTALQFARILSTHVPCLINDGLKDRAKLWNEWKSTQYLQTRMGEERTFKVAITPNGRADDLVTIDNEGTTVFALPHEEDMTFQSFIDALHPTSFSGSGSSRIAYLQSQNSNLTTSESSFGPLLDDLVDSESDADTVSHPSWAAEAIGKLPEATNIWIGTSKNHYENVFLVVRGVKIFTVIPPTEAHFLSGEDQFYPLYQWQSSATSDSSSTAELELKSVPESHPTPWIPIDPLPPQTPARVPLRPQPPKHVQDRWDLYRSELDPLRIEVRAGQMLYLPAGWFHAVEQVEDSPLSSGKAGPGICLGINWWWESEVGDRWAWLSLSRELDRRVKGVFEDDEEMI